MKHTEPELITQKLLDELHRIIPYDSDHLPAEIELIEVFSQRYPNLLQWPVLIQHFIAHATGG